MNRFIRITAAVLVTFALAAPAWADSTHDTIITGDNITNNTATGGVATATGGSVGPITTSGGTHIQTTTVTPIQNNTQVTTQGQGQEQGQYQGQGQGQTYQGEQNVTVKTDVPRQAPPAVPAALSVSSLTCYGSWSIAASTPFGGVGAGFPTKDADCEKSRNASILNMLGFPQAALALMAQNPDTAKALRDSGVTVPTQKVASAPVEPRNPVVAVAPVSMSEDVSACGAGMVVAPSGFCHWKK